MVREASKRVLGLRPFDVQLIGIFFSLLVVILCPALVKVYMLNPVLNVTWNVFSYHAMRIVSS